MKKVIGGWKKRKGKGCIISTNPVPTKPINQHLEIILEARRQTLKEVRRQLDKLCLKVMMLPGDRWGYHEKVGKMLKRMAKKGITDNQFNME